MCQLESRVSISLYLLLIGQVVPDDAESRNASTKSRTTSANDVAAVTRSENANSNLKKSKKSRVIKISDPEESDDDSLEREAALASPAKGAESRKATKVSKLYIYVRSGRDVLRLEQGRQCEN